MNDEIDGGAAPAAPVWPAFADLMSVLLGAFLLILVGVVGMQLELSSRLANEVKQRKAETERRKTLEEALAGPLAAGRVTLVNGRIGISGSVLFALNSDQLTPQGRDLLKSLAGPLTAYLKSRDEILMVSGFADDQQVHAGNRRFADNWELSAERALTVTRSFIDAGVPASSVFAAAFGSEQPVSANTDEAGRAKNRRVEIAAVPRPTSAVPAAHAHE
jgi:flagellar motor protein MotB